MAVSVGRIRGQGQVALLVITITEIQVAYRGLGERLAVQVRLDLGHPQALAAELTGLRVAEHVGKGGGTLRTAEIYLIVDGRVLDGGEAACGVLRVGTIVRICVIG